MSEPILVTNAEASQYVGDEVILSWNKKTGIEDANCVQVFFQIHDSAELIDNLRLGSDHIVNRLGSVQLCGKSDMWNSVA
jgi:hypothetical protein